MIKSISYSLYTVKSMANLAKQIYEVVNESHAQHTMLAPFLDSLQKAYQKGLGAVGENMGSMLTAEIKASDADRDTAYISLRNHIKAGINRPNETYSLAAQKIYRVFEQNNLKLYDFRYTEQSVALTRLFTDLASPENQEALKILHAIAWLEELKQAQTKFEELYTQRSQETVSTQKPTDAEAKKEISTALQFLLQSIGVLEAIGEPESILDTVNRVNVIIDKEQAAARR